MSPKSLSLASDNSLSASSTKICSGHFFLHSSSDCGGFFAKLFFFGCSLLDLFRTLRTSFFVPK